MPMENACTPYSSGARRSDGRRRMRLSWATRTLSVGGHHREDRRIHSVLPEVVVAQGASDVADDQSLAPESSSAGGRG